MAERFRKLKFKKEFHGHWGEVPEWEAKLRRKFIGIMNPQPKGDGE